MGSAEERATLEQMIEAIMNLPDDKRQYWLGYANCMIQMGK